MNPFNPFKKKATDESAIRYASFNARMFACTVDVIILTLIGVPIIELLDGFWFPPLDMDIFSKAITPEVLQNADTLLVALEKLVKDNHLIERSILVNLLQFIFVAAYILPFWMYYSSTPGKMLLRMEIQDEKTGMKMTRNQALLRFWGYIVSFIPLSLGFLWIAFNKKKMGWHDWIAGTIVVVKPKKPKIIQP